MPAKKTSPDAAQKKLWKAEIRDLEASRRKIRADFRNEQKRLIAISEKAHKAVLKFMARAEKQLPKAEADIDRRVSILKGRMGL
jgi:site-specific recombinase XerD